MKSSPNEWPTVFINFNRTKLHSLFKHTKENVANLIPKKIGLIILQKFLVSFAIKRRRGISKVRMEKDKWRSVLLERFNKTQKLITSFSSSINRFFSALPMRAWKETIQGWIVDSCHLHNKAICYTLVVQKEWLQNTIQEENTWIAWKRYLKKHIAIWCFFQC